VLTGYSPGFLAGYSGQGLQGAVHEYNPFIGVQYGHTERYTVHKMRKRDGLRRETMQGEVRSVRRFIHTLS
jgi:hypothetical protein